MNPDERKNWKDAALAEVLKAVVSDHSLSEALIFKGARILNLHLETQRQSLDIDTNLTIKFQQGHPDRNEQADWFEGQLTRALRTYFDDQDPVRYVIEGVKVKNQPPREPHLHGWDGLVAELRIRDQRKQDVRALPKLELEIAAPENLGNNAICDLAFDGVKIRAYALHRIAGEKLRAFLTSLPAYRNKINSPTRIARAKDLFDLARILEHKPITDDEFWAEAAEEFRLACESRFVDCAGLNSFQEEWNQTEQTYRNDNSLNDVPWEAAAAALETIVDFLTLRKTFPLECPIPTEESQE